MDILKFAGGGPWPLDPSEGESPVPMGLLLDISVAGPGGVDPRLDTVLWSPGMYGVAVCGSGREPLLWFWTDREPAKGEPMPMVGMDGWSGSVIFGRGGPVILTGLDRRLDPRCVAALSPPQESAVEVDGVEYSPPPGGVLRFRASGRMGMDTVGNVQSLPVSDLPLSAFVDDVPNFASEVRAISGAGPDENGNLTFRVFGLRLNPESPPTQGLQAITAGGIPLGFLIYATEYAKCSGLDPKRRIKCRTEHKITIPLPLDSLNCPEDVVCD